MAEFRGEDLRGSRFERVDLSGTNMRGVELVGARIDGEANNLVVDAVDVAPLVEAEHDRRYPSRVASVAESHMTVNNVQKSRRTKRPRSADRLSATPPVFSQPRPWSSGARSRTT